MTAWCPSHRALSSITAVRLDDTTNRAQNEGAYYVSAYLECGHRAHVVMSVRNFEEMK